MKLSVYGNQPTVWTKLVRLRNCATELSLVQRVHSGSLAMPSVQWRPMVLFVRKYRSNSEINTRCNNCVYSSQCFTLHDLGDNSTHHQEYNAVYGLSGRQVYLCCNFVNILVVLSLSVVLSCRCSLSCYAVLFLWMLSVEWVELSPETCRVKPLRRINAIVASCWIHFTTTRDEWLPLAYSSERVPQL